MRRLGKIITVLGLVLVLGGLATVITTEVLSRNSEKTAQKIVEQLNTLLPEKSEGVMENYSNNLMPVLEIEGKDVCATVNIPDFSVTLPVLNVWDKASVKLPCRFEGNLYNGSLIIGGSDQKGQFDFFDKIEDGSTVTVTDMSGAVFNFTVDRVERRKSAEKQVLESENADLTLFVRDKLSMEYIIVRCVLQNG